MELFIAIFIMALLITAVSMLYAIGFSQKVGETVPERIIREKLERRRLAEGIILKNTNIRAYTCAELDKFAHMIKHGYFGGDNIEPQIRRIFKTEFMGQLKRNFKEKGIKISRRNTTQYFNMWADGASADDLDAFLARVKK
jgi:hypothetical protein